MNPESRYAEADRRFVVCHNYTEFGELEPRILEDGTYDPSGTPKTEGRAALYRLTTLPLPDPPNFQVRAKVTDNFTLYAKEQYNDPTKWWIIADATPSLRHPFDLKPGDTVYIP